MLRQFLDLFRRESLLQQAYNRSLEMLDADREMFLAASSSLREHDDARIDLDIYARDQMINPMPVSRWSASSSTSSGSAISPRTSSSLPCSIPANWSAGPTRRLSARSRPPSRPCFRF